MSPRTYLFVRHAEAVHQLPPPRPSLRTLLARGSAGSLEPGVGVSRRASSSVSRSRGASRGEASRRARAFERGAFGDWPLTARGERQASLTGSLLAHAGIERVVSSTLRRARETAEHIARQASVPYEHAWPELDEIPPRTLRPAGTRRPEWLEGIVGVWHVHRHTRGVRGPLELAALERDLARVLARLDAMGEQRIAIVSHGYLILLLALLVPGDLRLRWIANCSITRVDAIRPGLHRLVSFARPPSTALRIGAAAEA